LKNKAIISRCCVGLGYVAAEELASKDANLVVH